MYRRNVVKEPLATAAERAYRYREVGCGPPVRSEESGAWLSSHPLCQGDPGHAHHCLYEHDRFVVAARTHCPLPNPPQGRGVDAPPPRSLVALPQSCHCWVSDFRSHRWRERAPRVPGRCARWHSVASRWDDRIRRSGCRCRSAGNSRPVRSCPRPTWASGWGCRTWPSRGCTLLRTVRYSGSNQQGNSQARARMMGNTNAGLRMTSPLAGCCAQRAHPGRATPVCPTGWSSGARANGTG